MPDPFGYHLLVDAYACDPTVCHSLDACDRFLRRLVEQLVVTMQAPPIIFQTDAARFPEKAGLSGWVPLVESGIQIHTITPQRFISVDLYSCHRFAVDPVLRVMTELLKAQTMEHQVLERGTRYRTQESTRCP